MAEALFESREELKVFVLDVIGASPLNDQVETLNGRVETLSGRVENIEQMFFEERAKGEERDRKIDAMYDMMIAMREDSRKIGEMDKKISEIQVIVEATASALQSHVGNKSIHVTPKRGRPKRVREQDGNL